MEPKDQQTPAATNQPVAVDNTAELAAAEQRGIQREQERQSGIRQAVRAARLTEEFAEELIKQNVPVDQARVKVLDELARATPQINGHVPTIQTVSDERDNLRAGITEALLHRHDPSAFKLGDNGRRFRGYSLLELATRCAEVSFGRSTIEGLDKMQRAQRGLHATSDFPLITADVANKTLRAGYEAAQRTFQPWARRATAVDFKEIRRVQLGEAPSLEKVLESGEFKRGTLAEGQEKYRLFTYGKIVGVTRQLIINDDLDAFTRLPQLFGQAAADLESDIMYSFLTGSVVMSDGNQLFSAPHGNLGTGAAIDIAGISAARKAMRKQKGLAGRFINVRPAIMIVGPDNETQAQKFLSSDYLANDNDKINVFANSMQLVVDPRIENFNWFVSANPAQIDTIEYAYLEGQEGVTLETDMGFSVDGMEMKVRHDFGAGAIEHRGLYKNPYAG